VRLTGCPLRCVYCDSAYAFSGGETQTIDSVLARVQQLKNAYVCVTGGEPLAQPACLQLLQRLCDAGYNVSLETSGALDISLVDTRVKRVVDVKTPSSQESHKNLSANYSHLNARDELKFVIASKQDFDWSLDYLQQYQLLEKTPHIVFSPMFDLPSQSDQKAKVSSQIASELASWILQANLPIRFQLQLHKILWGDEPGR